MQSGPKPLDEVGERCHKYASSAAVFGALPLQKLLIDLEHAAKGGDEVEVARRLEGLPEMMHNSLGQLQGLRPTELRV